MFVLEVVTALTTIILIRDLITGGGHLGFAFQIIFWLWFTVLFANFAEAVAEGRGKAQAESLRQSAHRDARPSSLSATKKGCTGAQRRHESSAGQIVLVEAGDMIPPTAR